MRDDVYERILYIINNTKGSKIIPHRECFKVLKEIFPDVSDYTIGSIYSLEYMRKMKQNHYKISKFAADLHTRFNAAVKEGQPEGILLRMSDEIDLSPALLARLIVEQRYQKELEENVEASSTKIPGLNSAGEPAMVAKETMNNSNISASNISKKEAVLIKSNVPPLKDSLTETMKSPALIRSKEEITKIPESNFTGGTVSIVSKAPPTIDSVTETMKNVALTETDFKIINTPVSSVAEDSTNSATAKAGTSEVNDEEALTESGYTPTRTTITSLIKDPTSIDDPHLAIETFLCTLHDDQYGPIADCVKHSLGQEYEMRLVRLARAAGLIFRSEGDLRTTGFDKTPDIKLDVPAVIDGFIINWIESKALFGDEETHKGYVKDQYQCYWNRFGSGMVIYWFGFLEKLGNRNQDQFLIAEDFPKNIAQMDPKPTMPKCLPFY